MNDQPYERCDICDELTRRAGKGEDSLYCDECDKGPFCSECWDVHHNDERLTSARVIMEKFVGKVDTRRAHSIVPGKAVRETHAEMKAWLEDL